MKINREKLDLVRARTCKGLKDIEATGIPHSTLCTAIYGKTVRPETAGRIARALGVDVTEIID